VALIRTDVSEDRIASIFRVDECEQAQSEVVSSYIGNDSQNNTPRGERVNSTRLEECGGGLE
jgi:hypothetical protein